ncbi:cobalt-precorrin-4/precorrin-4 C(11)-methyltransferase [Thermus filiformis]|uniref:Precorrin-4 C11-methyltransferase n=1 Tax=Thermus filiformis TaxID=276 RepID=A0A0D6XAM0_THEFI|nr:cobalt-precorrin-4/precorrin-4 C(11)-methyltransferase [Thermus filiformis]KIX84722.1 precorrin-4 C11-methyltransferase [Thermus filiformis]
MRPVVHVVGGGPGDPELLTVRGARLLQEARFVLYTGSLFPEEVLKGLAPRAELLDSKGMVLEEIVQRLAQEAGRGGVVVRLHSGDPGLYGTLLEEKEGLEALGVEVAVVPGVTAAFALAARAGLSLTAPEVAQAVAFTRLGVRTPVPPGQDPASLARPGLTLALYLSGMHPKRLARELREAGLPPDTPVLYGHRVGQAGEEVGLTDLAGLEGLPPRDTTVFLVGEALRARGKRSRLYEPSFKHRYRR